MADWCVTSSSNVHEGTPAVGAQSEVRGHTVPALVVEEFAGREKGDGRCTRRIGHLHLLQV
jgi:hypothetical protein